MILPLEGNGDRLEAREDDGVLEQALRQHKLIYQAGGGSPMSRTRVDGTGDVARPLAPAARHRFLSNTT